jgi:hypothetical protein
MALSPLRELILVAQPIVHHACKLYVKLHEKVVTPL